MRVLSILPFVAVLALGVGSRGDEPKSDSPTSLDAARRDLKELSTIRSDSSARPSFEDPSVMGPAFSSARPVVPVPEATQRNSQPSGWLLDGLNRNGSGLEKKSNRNGKMDTSGLANLKNDPNANPLGHYLQQWLTPESRSMLKVENGTKVPGSPPSAEDVEKSRSISIAALAPLVGQPRPVNFNRNSVNPYLDASGANTPLFPNEFSQPTSSATLKLDPASSRPTAYPLSQDKNLAPRSAKGEENLPPPTAPLLNEARYFPQLRRF